jgi:hypothetical protein
VFVLEAQEQGDTENKKSYLDLYIYLIFLYK